MLRLAVVAALASCASLPTFSSRDPSEAGVIFGALTIDGKGVEQLTFISQQAGLLGQPVFALLDARGYFAVIVPPGTWLLTAYQPHGGRRRSLPIDGSSKDNLLAKVGSGELVWVGAWRDTEEADQERYFSPATVDARDALTGLSPLARGTAWEAVFTTELAKRSPAPPSFP